MVSKGKGAIAVVGMVAALVTGCGSSDSNTTMSKAAFVKQAGAICKESEEKRGKTIAALAQKSNPNKNIEAQQARAVRLVMAVYQETAEQLDDLGAPKGEEKNVEALVEAMEEAVEKAKADPHTAAISNIFFRKADKLAEPYKLTSCMI